MEATLAFTHALKDSSAEGEMDGRPDAHVKPSGEVKAAYKKWQRLSHAALNAQQDLIDCNIHPDDERFPSDAVRLIPHTSKVLGPTGRGGPGQVFMEFTGSCDDPECDLEQPHKHGMHGVQAYELRKMPGLLIYPNFLTPSIQLHLLNQLLHRDLSNPAHQTNVHLHYNVSYPPAGAVPRSFFAPEAHALAFEPRAGHPPITTRQFLDKKLRWMTLGGQYDWTNKIYPSGPQPPFPSDVKKLIEGCFPMKAEAAIVNLYSPGDTLSVHRDVSEACAQPLVSISLGCEAIFFVAMEETVQANKPDSEKCVRTAAIRLRSGDAVLMSGRSRYAWHGVPKVLSDTCPDFLHDWPCIGHGGEQFAAFKGWMAQKRVNLNVRQML